MNFFPLPSPPPSPLFAIFLGDRSRANFSPAFNFSMLSLLRDLRFVIAVSSVTKVIIHSLKCTKELRGCKTRLRINHAFPDVPRLVEGFRTLFVSVPSLAHARPHKRTRFLGPSLSVAGRGKWYSRNCLLPRLYRGTVLYPRRTYDGGNACSPKYLELYSQLEPTARTSNDTAVARFNFERSKYF